MASAVQAALGEVVAALAAIAPAHEGLRDFKRLDLQPETQRDVRASLDQYDRRVGTLQAAKAALEALVSEGFPAMAPRAVSAESLRDLQDNVTTIAAARQQFVTAATSTLNLAPGGVEPK